MTFRGMSRAELWSCSNQAVITLAGIVVCSFGATSSGQDCETLHDPITYVASSGLMPNDMDPPWIGGCGNAQWIPGVIDQSLLHVIDDSTIETDPPNGLRATYCRLDVFDCSTQDAAFEVVGQAAMGADTTPPHAIDMVWLCGFRDFDKSMVLAFTSEAVGFITTTSPVNWLENDGQLAKVDLDTTDKLHIYRVEKNGQGDVKLFVDDALQLTWDYDALGDSSGSNRAMFATTSSPGQSEFWIESFRYRIGSTNFYVEPTACDADFDGNGAVAVADMLILLASWGPCEACPADIDDDDMVGVSDLLFMLSSWGPTIGCPSTGGIIVTGDACDPNIPESAYEVVDLGSNHFEVSLVDLYAPFDLTFFEIHPTTGDEILDNVFIDVEGPEAGSPVVIRVMSSCDDPDLKFDTVHNILETADGEHLLTLVDVDGDVGLIIVEAVGDVLLGGDLIDGIIATTPDNETRGITKVNAGGSILGDLLAPLGRIGFITAHGDIGTPESPILIEAEHYIRTITQAQNLYAEINTHTDGGNGSIRRIEVDRFEGSMDTYTMALTGASESILRFNVELAADIVLAGPYANPNKAIEVPVGGLQTQIIINADMVDGGYWGNGAVVKIGFDGDPGQIVLTGPSYTNTAESLGGGSIGVAPFDLHDESCSPVNGDTVELQEGDPALQVRLRHYGPIMLNANAPLTIERRAVCTADPFVQLPSMDFLYSVDPADGNSLLVSGSPGADGFQSDFEYRLIPTVDLMCAQVTGNPSVSWDSPDYRVTVCPCCLGGQENKNNGGPSQDDNGSIRGNQNRR